MPILNRPSIKSGGMDIKGNSLTYKYGTTSNFESLPFEGELYQITGVKPFTDNTLEIATSLRRGILKADWIQLAVNNETSTSSYLSVYLEVNTRGTAVDMKAVTSVIGSTDDETTKNTQLLGEPVDLVYDLTPAEVISSNYTVNVIYFSELQCALAVYGTHFHLIYLDVTQPIPSIESVYVLDNLGSPLDTVPSYFYTLTGTSNKYLCYQYPDIDSGASAKISVWELDVASLNVKPIMTDNSSISVSPEFEVVSCFKTRTVVKEIINGEPNYANNFCLFFYSKMSYDYAYANFEIDSISNDYAILNKWIESDGLPIPPLSVFNASYMNGVITFFGVGSASGTTNSIYITQLQFYPMNYNSSSAVLRLKLIKDTSIGVSNPFTTNIAGGMTRNNVFFVYGTTGTTTATSNVLGMVYDFDTQTPYKMFEYTTSGVSYILLSNKFYENLFGFYTLGIYRGKLNQDILQAVGIHLGLLLSSYEFDNNNIGIITNIDTDNNKLTVTHPEYPL